MCFWLGFFFSVGNCFNIFSESILSMDLGSTGPTSLRSNCTDDPEVEGEANGGEDPVKKIN